MLVFIPIKFIVFFEPFFDLELLFWGNVVIGCCLCSRLFGNLPGCSIIIFLTSCVVVEAHKHAYSLIGQNPSWHCETHRHCDPDMSGWFPLGLHVSNSAVEQTVEILFVDRISPLIAIPPLKEIFFCYPWHQLVVLFLSWHAHAMNRRMNMIVHYSNLFNVSSARPWSEFDFLTYMSFLTADCLYGDWTRLRLAPPTSGFTWCWNWRSFIPFGSIDGVCVGDWARWYSKLVCAVPWPLDNFWKLFWPVVDIPLPMRIEFLLKLCVLFVELHLVESANELFGFDF